MVGRFSWNRQLTDRCDFIWAFNNVSLERDKNFVDHWIGTRRKPVV